MHTNVYLVIIVMLMLLKNKINKSLNLQYILTVVQKVLYRLKLAQNDLYDTAFTFNSCRKLSYGEKQVPFHAYYTIYY